MRRTSRRPASCAAFTYSSTTDLISRGENACRSRRSSIGIRCATSPRRIGGGDDGLDTAPDGKIADDGHAARGAGRDEIVENPVGDRFEEDALVAELDQVVLEGLQLDAALGGNVGNPDLAEVGQTCFRADGGEFRAADRNLELALRARIRKGVDRRRA